MALVWKESRQSAKLIVLRCDTVQGLSDRRPLSTLRDIENTLIELYEEGLVTYSVNESGEVLWEITPIMREAIRLGLDISEL